VGAQERLLRDVLGLGPAAQHPERDAEDPVLVGRHQLLEGARVPGAEPAQQDRIVV
jgi:hypothetical protein